MIKSITDISKNPKKLISKLFALEFPFAVWKNPQSNESQLIIDITTKEQPKTTDGVWPMEEYAQCFVINPYVNSHPSRPEVITGDIIISLNENRLTINPSLSSSQLESFLNRIKNVTIPEVTSEQKLKTESDNYEHIVAKAIEMIKQDQLQKVVLSRFKDFDKPANFNAYDFFVEISKKYENAFCYLVSSKEYGVWLGATPERLIVIENNRLFTTDALAGTQKLGESMDLADIAWTQKEIEEQAMVSRYIIDCFKKIRLRDFEELGPKTAKAGNLVHLKTTFRVDMEATNSPELGSTMLDLLHPTSAVCGFPREAANEFIKTEERFDRELFTGFLGPVNFNNETRLYVNLRCMKLMSYTLRLFAGAGITADSKPSKEYEETTEKMNTLLSALKY